MKKGGAEAVCFIGSTRVKIPFGVPLEGKPGSW